MSASFSVVQRVELIKISILCNPLSVTVTSPLPWRICLMC